MCWTEYQLSGGFGLGRGTIWTWPDFLPGGEFGGFNDSWCRSHSIGPALAMHGHSAPLGIEFYRGQTDVWNNSTCKDEAGQSVGLPDAWRGHAIISFHGSWNRDNPTGYKVVRVPFTSPGDSVPSGEPIDLLRHDGNTAQWPHDFRPVDPMFDECGRLFMSDDTSGTIVVIARNFTRYLGNDTSEDDDDGKLSMDAIIAISILVPVFCIGGLAAAYYCFCSSASAKPPAPNHAEAIANKPIPLQSASVIEHKAKAGTAV